MVQPTYSDENDARRNMSVACQNVTDTVCKEELAPRCHVQLLLPSIAAIDSCHTYANDYYGGYRIMATNTF